MIHNNISLVQIKKLNEDAIIPTRGSDFAAGYDVYSTEDVEIPVGETVLVGTGLSMAIPVNKVLLLYPRSGLASKKGLRLANGVGVIDADYRGEIGVILINLSNEVQSINRGDRIAQIVIAKHEIAELIETDTLDETERGKGGFGHSGVK